MGAPALQPVGEAPRSILLGRPPTVVNVPYRREDEIEHPAVYDGSP
jgi:hypothetical protein